MRDDSRNGTEAQEPWWGRDRLVEVIRQQVHGMIERVLEEELAATLGTGRYDRAEGRQGYRHGHVGRVLTSPQGPTRLRVPRGRLWAAAGRTVEWTRHLLARYRRRMRSVDAAVLGCYLGGVNTRRVKTQAALLTTDAALVLLYGLVVSGLVRLRRIDGWADLAHVMSQPAEQAA